MPQCWIQLLDKYYGSLFPTGGDMGSNCYHYGMVLWDEKVAETSMEMEWEGTLGNGMLWGRGYDKDACCF